MRRYEWMDLHCITSWDIVVFAVAPKGVITAVVSAIRICGTPSLRAFVGRAQEGAGVAEAELCSSTSREVCEVYSNGGISRVFGRPKLLEIVHDPEAPIKDFFPIGQNRGEAGIYSFQDYIKTEKGRSEWTMTQGNPADPGDDELDPVLTSAWATNPNLSLNIGIKPLHRLWFIAAAALGIVLQSSVLVWATLARYYYQWLRDSREGTKGFPMGCKCV
ncbi:hypothetical protein PG988_012439 [Apiospora saccharicola]